MNISRNMLSALVAALAVLFAVSGKANAAAIDVLWYSYAHPTSEYISGIQTIASTAESYTQADGTEWALSIFAPGDAAPDFNAYDVLVVHSGEAFRTNAPGGPLETPEYSGILSNRAAIEAARGARTVISGSDADFHAVRGDTGNPGSPPPMTDAAWDGALGHVVNAVNWAGAGSGLNIVSFYDGEFPGSFWWLDPDSFLRDELLGHTGHTRDNSPFLPPTLASLSINEGLTTLGLSNWRNSFHGNFALDIPGYSTAILDREPAEGDPGFALTIFRDDALAIAVPGPTTFWLFVLSIIFVVGLRRRVRCQGESKPA